jgi:hypothetical protein
MATLLPVFFVSLTDTPGAKHRYQVGYAAPVSFEQYESVFGDRAGDPRNDQRIGQERAKAKSASCISFQIVEYASNDGCQSPFFRIASPSPHTLNLGRNTFQTWMMPKDMHGYRTAGFGVPNWDPILRAHCSLPKTTPPQIQCQWLDFHTNLNSIPGV